MKKTLIYLGALTFATIGMAQAPPEAPGLKFTGFLQYRTEWTQNPRVTASEAGLAQNSDYGPSDVDSKNESRTLVWFNVDNQFDGHTRFHAVLAGENLAGRTTGSYLKVMEGYVEAKFGHTTAAVGRFMSDVGLGTLGGGPFMDGAHVASGNEFIKAQVYLCKFGNPGQSFDYNVADKANYTFLSGDVKLTPVKGLTLSAAYFSDTTSQTVPANVLGGQLYKDVAAGFEYKYETNHIPWFTLAGEYADNSAPMAKKINGTAIPMAGLGDPRNPAVAGADPKAYYVKAKVMGANPFMPGTGGLYVQYRKADAGFDVMGMANPQTWTAPFNWTTPSGAGIADNAKGIEAGAEITILPRCIFKVTYAWMKLVNTTSTLDVASPSLAVVSAVYPGVATPAFAFGGQNRINQNFMTASIFYLF